MKKLLLILVLSLLLSGNTYAKIIKLEKCMRWIDGLNAPFIDKYAEYLEIDFYDYNGDHFNEDKYTKFTNQKWSEKAYNFYNTIWFDEKKLKFTSNIGKPTVKYFQEKKKNSSIYSTKVFIESSFTINTDDKSIIEYYEYTDKFVELSRYHHRTGINEYNKKNSTNDKPFERKKFRKNVIKFTGNAGDRFFGSYKYKSLAKEEYTFDIKKNEILYLTEYSSGTQTTLIKCK